jgi:hypothetical protein
MTTDMPTFHFGNYSLRPAQISDLPNAAAWTKADADHCGNTLPMFWIRQQIGINCFVLDDGEGDVFFFRMVRYQNATEVEVHIQFAPEEIVSRQRTMTALTIGFAWLEARLHSLGFRLLYFYSRNQNLIYFCQKRLGFTWDGRRLERAITDRKVTDGEANGEATQCDPNQGLRAQRSA